VTNISNEAFPKSHLKRNTRSFGATFFDKTVVVISKLQHCSLMQGNACLMMDELETVIEIESTVSCKTRKKSPGVPKQMKQNQS
jgi:hypothetical protein